MLVYGVEIYYIRIHPIHLLANFESGLCNNQVMQLTNSFRVNFEVGVRRGR